MLIKPSLNQVSHLTEILQNDPAVQKHYITENLFDTLSENIVSEKQYKYILALIYNNKRAKLNKVLVDLGLKPVQYVQH
jgi:hypothetical protein